MEGTQWSTYNNSLFWTGQFDKLVRGKEYISSTDQKRKKNKDWTKEIKIVPPCTVSFHSLSHCDKKGLQRCYVILILFSSAIGLYFVKLNCQLCTQCKGKPGWVRNGYHVIRGLGGTYRLAQLWSCTWVGRLRFFQRVKNASAFISVGSMNLFTDIGRSMLI